MLVFGAVCVFVALALLIQVPVLAPKYATFGPQTVRGGQLHCSFRMMCRTVVMFLAVGELS